MKVLHLAAGNRWTGAAATAFAETAALREASVDAHFAYVGGYKLQQKLAHYDFAHPVIGKAQNPWSFAGSVEMIARLIARHRFEVVHAHLTYDHWLAFFATRDRRAAVVRTFHARRVLRSDPLTRRLVARSELVFINNASFAALPLAQHRNAIFTPPPIDQRQFHPVGPDVRDQYGIGADALLIMAIGKLSKDRGFEDVLRTFALVHREIANARLMIIGHGEHRPALEALARSLAVDVLWAGYHEDDLAEHYRAADVLLFTARGSDEGHRAVLEAMACGVVPVTFPLDGMPTLLGDLADPLIAADPTAESAAAKIVAVERGNIAGLRRSAYERSKEFGYLRAAERLIEAYDSIVGARQA